MVKKNSHSLPPPVKRAAIVIPVLLFLFIALTTSTVYAGWKNGELEKKILTPLNNWWVGVQEATKVDPTPAPVVLPSPTYEVTPSPVPTKAPQKTSVQNTQPVVSNCTRLNIREGEFASNKCYSAQDYEDLQYYLSRFNSAVFSKDGAESSMRITCECSRPESCEFFKDSCSRDKARKETAEADISKYRGIIQGIIARGK